MIWAVGLTLLYAMMVGYVVEILQRAWSRVIGSL